MIVRHAIIARTFIRMNVDPFEFFVLARLYANQYAEPNNTSEPFRENLCFETEKNKRWVDTRLRIMARAGFIVLPRSTKKAPMMTVAGLERFLYTIADMCFIGADMLAVQASQRYESKLRNGHTRKLRKLIETGVIAPGTIKQDADGRFNLPNLFDIKKRCAKT